jgi:hypothetical protein
VFINALQLSSISLIAVAIMCQSLFPTLVERTNNYHPSSTAVLHSNVGKFALASLWIVAFLSTTATILWIIGACRKEKRQTRPERKQGSNFTLVPTIVRRATGSLLRVRRGSEDTSYEKMRAPRSRQQSRSSSRTKIVSRDASRERPSSTMLHDSEVLADDPQTSHYEPFRHHEVPQ